MGLPLSRLIVLCLAWGAVAVRAEQPYFPPPGDAWATRPPASVGVDPDKLAAAVKFAQSNEVAWPLDVRAQIEKDTAQEPYPEIIGPVKPRGGQNGIILRRGFIVAEWGDTKRVDVTFSVAKSYLSLMAGLAFDRGLIPDVHEPVGIRVKDGGFDSPHNSPITWHMLLTHTSEWEGVLWDKPDVADRRRGYYRTLQQPGTFWEYNDVRVNRLALSLLRVWQRPLPEVLKEVVMDPIGASSEWAWYGYFNSYVDLGGQRVQSVSGGTHWGGGIWASTRDHARFGYLWLRKGEWAGKRILSERWVDMATKPVDIAPFYGYLFWLPAASSPVFRDVPPRSYFALGSGGNMIYVDPDRDLVAVVRWLDIPKLGEFVKLVAAAVDGGSSR